MRPTLPRVLLAFATLITGCASPSVWERELQRGPELSPATPTLPDSITVRRVPWERVESALAELDRQVVASDVHPDEWPDDKKQAAKGTLLRGLQVSSPPSSVRLLGRSSFRTTDTLPRDEASLREVGARLGATMVVYSTRVLGKADKIVSQPVTSNTWGSGWRRDRDDNYRPDSYSESTTSWIPVRITADETGAIAYFLFVE